MARGDWGFNHRWRGKSCSYKRITLVICTVNIIIALYVLHSLYTSVYIYAYDDSRNGLTVRYTPDQIRKMEESIRIRKAAEPIQLINLVKEIKERFLSEEKTTELPQHLKQKISDEIITKLRSLNADAADGSARREAIESWRKETLEEAKQLILQNSTHQITAKTLNLSILPEEEAGMLVRALESNWAKLSEEIGLWIPVQALNEEHDDKPDGAEEEEEEILPGRKLPPECNVELHTDYGGAAVRWGLTHHKDSAYECCQACLDHARRAKPEDKKCNIWVYCPSENGCYSPDIYEHKLGECWLKFAETPKLTFKDKYPESYRNAPLTVPWVSGVTSA